MHCYFPQTESFTQINSDHSGSSECHSYTQFLLFVLLVFEFVFVRKFVFAVCLCRAHLTDYPGSEYDTNTYFVKTQIHDFLMIMTMTSGKTRLVRTFMQYLQNIYKICMHVYLIFVRPKQCGDVPKLTNMVCMPAYFVNIL